MLENYDDNKKIDEIYDNEYLRRYKEIAEIKDKIDSANSSYVLSDQGKKQINSIFKMYLSNQLKDDNGNYITTKA
jgi:hypothetical protein